VSRIVWHNSSSYRLIPPEPPVALRTGPERRGECKGAPGFGAAQRTLVLEHRCGICSSRRAAFGRDQERSCWWAQSFGSVSMCLRVNHLTPGFHSHLL
jgi:hypothetical protein